MDKMSMTLGYLMGRTIAGQRMKQAREPVAYLYNGVRLPKLPEWDKEKYPYAVITPIMSGGFCKVLVCAGIAYRFGYDGNYEVGLRDGVMSCNNIGDSWTTPADEWSALTEVSDGFFTDGVYWLCELGDAKHIRWTNTDILNEDGTVWLAATDPVPVYE